MLLFRWRLPHWRFRNARLRRKASRPILLDTFNNTSATCLIPKEASRPNSSAGYHSTPLPTSSPFNTTLRLPESSKKNQEYALNLGTQAKSSSYNASYIQSIPAKRRQRFRDSKINPFNQTSRVPKSSNTTQEYTLSLRTKPKTSGHDANYIQSIPARRRQRFRNSGIVNNATESKKRNAAKNGNQDAQRRNVPMSRILAWVPDDRTMTTLIFAPGPNITNNIFW